MRGMLALIVLFLVLFPLFTAAYADGIQIELARQIEKESESNTIFLGDQTSRYMKIEACEIESEATQKTSSGTLKYGYKFNLSHSILPKIPPQSIPNYGILDLDEEGKIGVLQIQFIPPHRASPYGDIPTYWPWGSISGLEFTMKELVDLEQPRRLLALLHKYQEKFCKP